MKSVCTLLICMAGAAGSVLVVGGVWGLWSLPAFLLVIAVTCLELFLFGRLMLALRQRQRLARFGGPLRYEHLPTYDAPLGIPRAARRRRPAHLGTG